MARVSSAGAPGPSQPVGDRPPSPSSPGRSKAGAAAGVAFCLLSRWSISIREHRRTLRVTRP